MKADVYNDKLIDILNLPQFEKSKRKNEEHPVLKEERIISLLKMLRDDGKTSDLLYDELRGCLHESGLNFNPDSAIVDVIM